MDDSRIQAMRDNRVYISGSITGTDDYMERFSKAEKELEAQGFGVINPAKVNAQLPADNCYDVEPDEPGIYQIYRHNGSKGKAYYKGNHIWQQLTNNGWSFSWWRDERK